MERRDCLFTLAGFLEISEFQTGFLQSWGAVTCWSESLILYLVLVRTEEGDRSITDSAVASFQVTVWKLTSKY